MTLRGKLTILLLTICNTIALAQSCDQLTGTTRDNTGATIFAFKNPIEITANKKGLSIYGCMIDNTVVVIFQMTGGDPCVEHLADIHFEFTDGTKLDLKNLYNSNCEQKAMLYFTKELNNLDYLEILKSKQITRLKIGTTPPKFMQIDVPAAIAMQLTESLKCLSIYFGVTPPQEEKPVDALTAQDTTETFVVVEQQPEFEGGYVALLNFIKKNLQLPRDAKKIKGSVVDVTFIIAHDGSVQDAKVLRGVREDVDAEALRVVRLIPKWRPGMQNGKPVIVRFNIPIKF